MSNRIIFFIVCCILAGCSDTVDYSCSNAMQDTHLSSIILNGNKYIGGKHDLDLGSVECYFEMMVPLEKIEEELTVNGCGRVSKTDNSCVLKAKNRVLYLYAQENGILRVVICRDYSRERKKCQT